MSCGMQIGNFRIITQSANYNQRPATIRKMKYGKSAFPYLALLCLILIGMPLANYNIQKTQQIVIEVELKKEVPVKPLFATKTNP